jgi:hypothetical protein
MSSPLLSFCHALFLTARGREASVEQASSFSFVGDHLPLPEVHGSLGVPLNLRPAFLFERADDGLVEDQLGGRSYHPDDQGRDLCWG